jgi:hypothetical protein
MILGSRGTVGSGNITDSCATRRPGPDETSTNVFWCSGGTELESKCVHRRGKGRAVIPIHPELFFCLNHIEEGETEGMDNFVVCGVNVAILMSFSPRTQSKFM